MGHMVNGKRHGRGTLRTAAFVYSSDSEYTQENAVENAHCAQRRRRQSSDSVDFETSVFGY